MLRGATRLRRGPRMGCRAGPTCLAAHRQREPGLRRSAHFAPGSSFPGLSFLPSTTLSRELLSAARPLFASLSPLLSSPSPLSCRPPPFLTPQATTSPPCLRRWCVTAAWTSSTGSRLRRTWWASCTRWGSQPAACLLTPDRRMPLAAARQAAPASRRLLAELVTDALMWRRFGTADVP